MRPVRQASRRDRSGEGPVGGPAPGSVTLRVGTQGVMRRGGNDAGSETGERERGARERRGETRRCTARVDRGRLSAFVGGGGGSWAVGHCAWGRLFSASSRSGPDY